MTSFDYTREIIFRIKGDNYPFRTSKIGPCPNYWTDRNVWVDENGWLHLKITYRDGRWYCAEVYTKEPLEYGTYVFYVDSRIDNLECGSRFICLQNSLHRKQPG